jgi:hypothetical protein
MRSSSKAIDRFENHLDHGKKQADEDCDDPQHGDELQQRLTSRSATALPLHAAIDRTPRK